MNGVLPHQGLVVVDEVEWEVVQPSVDELHDGQLLRVPLCLVEVVCHALYVGHSHLQVNIVGVSGRSVLDQILRVKT